jgi:hypothetical protein
MRGTVLDSQEFQQIVTHQFRVKAKIEENVIGCHGVRTEDEAGVMNAHSIAFGLYVDEAGQDLYFVADDGNLYIFNMYCKEDERMTDVKLFGNFEIEKKPIPGNQGRVGLWVKFVDGDIIRVVATGFRDLLSAIATAPQEGPEDEGADEQTTMMYRLNGEYRFNYPLLTAKRTKTKSILSQGSSGSELALDDGSCAAIASRQFVSEHQTIPWGEIMRMCRAAQKEIPIIDKNRAEEMKLVRAQMFQAGADDAVSIDPGRDSLTAGVAGQYAAGAERMDPREPEAGSRGEDAPPRALTSVYLVSVERKEPAGRALREVYC